MDLLKGKRILITGGSGYVGKFLIKKLRLFEPELHIFDININNVIKAENIFYHFVNLLNYNLLKKEINTIKPNIVFHLASNNNRIRDYNIIDSIIDINLNGTNNLLRSLINIDYSSFIYTSTSEVYGNQKKTPFTENMVISPTSPYSLSKAYAEMAIQTFSKIYRKPFTILRLFNIFGPYLPEDFFIPQLIKALIDGSDFNMTKGEQKRDFIFIDDVINSLIISSTNKNAHNQIFNICSGNSISLYELTILIKKNLASKSKINIGKIPYRKNEIWNMVGSNEKAKEKISFAIKTNLINGLKEILNEEV